jgi:hypothetical protein
MLVLVQGPVALLELLLVMLLVLVLVLYWRGWGSDGGSSEQWGARDW